MERLHQYIDTIVGAIGDIPLGAAVEAGGGKTYPGAVAPFGMVQFSPDTITGGDNASGYSYHHNTIEGFSINHLSGTGWYGDLGNFQVMPVVGETPFHSGTNKHCPYQPGVPGRESKFSHDSEVTKAGYYRVFLSRYGVNVETTALIHTGVMRMTFPKTREARVLIDLSRRIGGHSGRQEIHIVDNSTIEGSIFCPYTAGGLGHGKAHVTYTLYFYAQFSRPFEKFGIWDNGEDLGALREHRGEVSIFYGEYEMEEAEELLLKVGISYKSLENARSNFEKEAPHWEFEQYVDKAQRLWDNQLSVYKVEGHERELRKFYTCLYHVFLDPRIYDGGEEDSRRKKELYREDFCRRTVFSGWDVFRSEIPLLTILQPEVVNDTITSLIDIAKKEDGPLARWELLGTETGCMVGDPGMIIVADAYCKGIRNFDVQTAWKICRDTSFGKYPGRGHREEMIKFGYIPGDISETLENAFADWCVSRFAKALGYNKEAELLTEQSLGYRKIFDTEFGWMRRKDENGQWMECEGIYDMRGCVESNIFQQSWFAPHDIQKLIEMMGGRDVFCEKLERLLEEADLSALWNDAYNHSNEPCHTVVHLFNHAGRPWRTQYWVRRIQNEAYHEGPYGFCGNEDVGQMSGWFVMTAMGFHSTTAASNQFDLNTPYFQKQVIQLSPKYHSCAVSDCLVIETDCNPTDNWYIKEVTLNGKKLNRSYITYQELTAGGVLRYQLSNEPCKTWCVEG